MKRKEIHFSELSTAQGCKRRWQYSYVERLAPVMQDNRITVGTLVHHAIEQSIKLDAKEGCESYKDRAFLFGVIQNKVEAMKADGLIFADEDDEDLSDNPEAASLLAEEENQELLVKNRAVTVAMRMLEHYHQNYKVARHPKTGEPLIEYQVRVPVKRKGKPTVDYVGTIDIVSERLSDGAVLLTDYKVRGKLVGLVSDLLHSQTALYQYALLQQTGLLTHGSCVIEGLNKEESEIKLTKAGKPYKTAVLTTPEKFIAALESCGISADDPEYAETLEKIAARPWVQSNVIPRRADSPEIQNTWQLVLLRGLADLEAAAKQTGERAILIGYQCRTCAYFPLCESELGGYDTQWIKDTQFKVKAE